MLDNMNDHDAFYCPWDDVPGDYINESTIALRLDAIYGKCSAGVDALVELECRSKFGFAALTSPRAMEQS